MFIWWELIQITNIRFRCSQIYTAGVAGKRLENKIAKCFNLIRCQGESLGKLTYKCVQSSLLTARIAPYNRKWRYLKGGIKRTNHVSERSSNRTSKILIAIIPLIVIFTIWMVRRQIVNNGFDEADKMLAQGCVYTSTYWISVPKNFACPWVEQFGKRIGQ